MTYVANGSSATPVWATAAVVPVKERYTGTDELSLVNTAYTLPELAPRIFELVPLAVGPVDTVAVISRFGASAPRETLELR